MALAAIVETVRRKIAIEEGLSDDPTTVVSMSALWLIPQFSVLGFAMALNGVGQIEYFYSELPKTMSSMGMAFYNLGSGFAGLLSSLVTIIVNKVTQSGGNISWLSTNLNKGHYDYQYGLISFLCFLNFVCYRFGCRGSGTQKDVRARVSNEKDLKEALLSSKSKNTLQPNCPYIMYISSEKAFSYIGTGDIYAADLYHYIWVRLQFC
ncbi:NRT1/ PTR FAMILY 1.1 [Thalictrum thalictroides]|uniref:NRT1/ PTR FAMILY 1.1 n=1 Tax=Thalictrum thalictroides TaxID=46969 RepID=A0A7J6WEY5_THATH|nr:NRT1/ PTR FAMILY 1.1 [Thalictrum thalictroides]